MSIAQQAACPSVLRHTRIRSFDPATMTHALQHGELESVQLECGDFQGRIAHSTSASMRCDWGTYNIGILVRGGLSRDMVSVALLIAGKGHWRVHGRSMRTGDLLVFPENSELLIALPPDAQWLCLQVPRARLESAAILGTRQLYRSPVVTSMGLRNGLDRALSELAAVLAPQRAAMAIDAAQVTRAHEDLLLAFLGELTSRGDTQCAVPLSRSERSRIIQRTEEFLQRSVDLSVRIDDLCEATGTTFSTLERAFREVFGASPRRFLSLRRLAAVRRELMLGDPAASITEIAMRWGFFHLGRFSREYRDLYAESPSATLRRVRGN